MPFPRKARYHIVGLELQGSGSRCRAWLARFGDPYAFGGRCRRTGGGDDYGVRGVPKTYVIDKAGNICPAHRPVTPGVAEVAVILPLVAELEK